MTIHDAVAKLDELHAESLRDTVPFEPADIIKRGVPLVADVLNAWPAIRAHIAKLERENETLRTDKKYEL